MDDTNVVGCYFPGVGLAGVAGLPAFFEYITNGLTGHDIKDRSVEVYRFIVEHFTENSEVWMLGLSRGAYTVRLVAGMIDRFGILDRGKAAVDLDIFCPNVYAMYTSNDEEYLPEKGYPAKYKADFCMELHGGPPIKFMGLLDTVGSLGVPNISARAVVEYNQTYYNQIVSDAVENVYHALAAHDRLFGFEPCFVRRRPGTSSGVTEEVWFPGAHYDLGRQRFVPFRTTGGLLERAAHKICDMTNMLLINIEPTLDCSVEPLKWMLGCMRQTDPNLLDGGSCSAAVDKCLVPWQNRGRFVQVLTKDAFDHMIRRFFFGCFYQQLARYLLRDRVIPQYRQAQFIGRRNGPDPDNEPAFISPGSGFMSRAYNNYRDILGYQAINWVDGHPFL